jgi:predicted nuclease of predicted toxin-antitoxin system
MRILLDESVPIRLGSLLLGHDVSSVQRQGWAGIKNGKLLALAAAQFDVLLTADQGIEYQQNLAALPMAVLIVSARSNRMADMAPMAPKILEALVQLPPRTLHKVTA